ncbi:zinc-ribbon domain-containing protein [soil metagenome]
MPKPTSCPSCGARLRAGAESCSLCGTPVPTVAEEAATSESFTDSVQSESAPSEVTPESTPAAVPVSRTLECAICGFHNPLHARFCSQCGAGLDERMANDETAAEATAVGDAPDGIGRRLGAMLGVAILAVVVLYGVSALSGRSGTPLEATNVAPTAIEEPALDDQQSARVAVLERQRESSSDSLQMLAINQEIVEIYARGGRLVRAGEAQEEVARSVNSAFAWADAGSLYFEALLRAPEDARSAIAPRAISAYERSLEIDPHNLDVRTNLGVAYQYSATPMEAVETLRTVLEAEPDHLHANFNFALMLAQIGRYDQAAERFERVLTITEAGDPIHTRAQEELARARRAGGL